MSMQIDLAQLVAAIGDALVVSDTTCPITATHFDEPTPGEIVGAEQKLRWSLPNDAGDLEPTDFGVAVSSRPRIGLSSLIAFTPPTPARPSGST
jgi:hypothetical protein